MAGKKKASTPVSDMEEINSIIRDSGNSFHCRVTNWLVAKGWTTMVSPYYMDNSTNKPREIDLIAEKAWQYRDDFEDKYGSINVKLFIECKYIPQKNVFWFDEKDHLSTKELVLKSTPLTGTHPLTQKHHYIKTNKKVAKLFASRTLPNQENEPIYKALNQSLNAMVYLRGRGSIVPQDPRYTYNILQEIEMPIILCNSFENFYKVDMKDSDNPQAINENFQLEVNYAYMDINKTQRNDYFLIDVVDFHKLDDYLDLIESDVQAIYQVI